MAVCTCNPPADITRWQHHPGCPANQHPGRWECPVCGGTAATARGRRTLRRRCNRSHGPIPPPRTRPRRSHVADRTWPTRNEHTVRVYLSPEDSQWRWRVQARNGEIVATGEAHASVHDAERAARALFPVENQSDR